MLDFTTYQWVMLAVTLAVAAANLLWQRLQTDRNNDAANIPKPFYTNQEPTMDGDAGTPSLKQLTQGMKLNRRAMKLAQTLYGMGSEQYNHPVNNRDRIIRESRTIMAELASVLGLEELKLADETGRTAASGRV